MLKKGERQIMKIYFETLCFVLKDLISKEKISSFENEIGSFRYASMQCGANPNAAYILYADSDDIFSFREFLRKDLPETGLNFLIISDADCDLDKNYPEAIFSEKDNYALIRTEKNHEDITSVIEEKYLELIKWESSFNEILLYEDDINKFFALGKRYLPYQYFIFDRDLNSVYNSDERMISSENYYRSLEQYLYRDLISDKAFHDAANETDIFYYENLEGVWGLCSNVRAGKEYIARIIVIVGKSKDAVHKGCENLFRIYSEYVNRAFGSGKFSVEQHSSDQPHRILKEAAGGKRFPLQTLNINFDHFLKDSPRNFSVIIFRFYNEELWPAQLEVTLPYMAASLEKVFSGSIACALKEEIVLLMKHADNSDPDFLKKIASFVRENLCKAGISPEFEDLADISFAVNSARAALETGNESRPHLWYYTFDDLRLEYILSCCTKNISADLICHPAIKTLKKYDAKHSGELCRTLYVYIKNNLNMTQAAEEMFIHRTTFFHRMNKIRELTKLDLDDPKTVLELKISYEIIKKEG